MLETAVSLSFIDSFLRDLPSGTSAMWPASSKIAGRLTYNLVPASTATAKRFLTSEIALCCGIVGHSKKLAEIACIYHVNGGDRHDKSSSQASAFFFCCSSNSGARY